MGYFQRIPARKTDGDFTRISVSVFENLGQNIHVRQTASIKRSPVLETYSFLIVDQVFEQLSHTWSEYANIAGKISELQAVGSDALKKVKLGAKGLIGGGYTDLTKSYKADAPLVYDGSDRRKMNLTVLLMDQDNPETIMTVVNELRKFGSAKSGDGKAQDSIKAPHIFELTSWPNPAMFSIKHAVLNQMMATFKYPFIRGLPTQIEMVLEFEDMQPLYDNSFNRNADVTVKQNGLVISKAGKETQY